MILTVYERQEELVAVQVFREEDGYRKKDDDDDEEEEDEEV